MNSFSPSSPPDLASLSLASNRSQIPHDSYDYEQSPIQRQQPQYTYQSSPPILPVQPPFSSSHPLPPLRQSKPTRAALPSQWLDSQPLPEGRSLSPYQMSDLSSGGASPPPINGLPGHTFQSPPPGPLSADDDIIPNAIVIKNIPFNVKRETLLDIITSLNIPTPYAFNYHLDQAGAFRGLAFANFRAPEDADAVVAALNGFDVQGRKLRVEYKKVLQAGEKERIEREKALRRMRSMQLEKERQNMHQLEDYGTPTSGLYSTQNSAGFQGSLYQSHSSSPPSGPVAPGASYLSPTTAASKVSSSNELDMNDPATLEIYSRILLFKDDPMRDELAFSRTLTPKQRRIVHLIAQKLGVYHYSVGENEDRYAVVTRIDPETNQRTVPQRHTSQTLSRATSSYLQSTSQSESSAGLRSKKSMPDMKTLHTTTPRLGIRASNSNLREGYATIASPSRRQNGFGALFGANGGVFGGDSSIPPVPSLPSNLSFNGVNEQPASGIVRQPRGPGEGGFTLRRTSGILVQGESNTGGLLDARSQTDLEI